MEEYMMKDEVRVMAQNAVIDPTMHQCACLTCRKKLRGTHTQEILELREIISRNEALIQTLNADRTRLSAECKRLEIECDKSKPVVSIQRWNLCKHGAKRPEGYKESEACLICAKYEIEELNKRIAGLEIKLIEERNKAKQDKADITALVTENHSHRESLTSLEADYYATVGKRDRTIEELRERTNVLQDCTNRLSSKLNSIIDIANKP